MHFTSALIAASLAVLASAAPTKTLQARASRCSQYASVTAGAFTIQNNLWGESAASGGGQCFGVNSLKDGTLSWDTTWHWEGAKDNVKSYANAISRFTHKKLSEIKSMKSKWSWTYSGKNLEADVSYDLFTSSTPGGANEYEIMIWLAALGGAQPISTSYGANGKAVPIATTKVAGHTFHLYKGPNGDTTVYSFVAESKINHFSADIHNFLKFLVEKHHIPSSQFLTHVSAGTEAFTGSNAHFKTKAYSMKITEH